MKKYTLLIGLLTFAVLILSSVPSFGQSLDTWTPRESGTSAMLWSVTYGNGLFVAAGKDGVILTSPDGVTWTKRNSGTLEWFFGVTYGNNMFVAVGGHGVICTSTTGTTWTVRTPVNTDWLDGVAWGAGRFVAVGNNGTIITSPTGATWTKTVSGTTRSLHGIVYGVNQFVAAGDGEALTSSDGITWTSRYPNSPLWLNGIAYGNGLYVMVAGYGTILTSSDGITWTKRASGISDELCGVTYGNGTYVAVGRSGALVTSPDGVTWTVRDSGTSNLLYGAAYGDDSFILVGDLGTILQSGSGAIGSPDLVVQGIVTSPALPRVGSTVSVTVTVRNQGSAYAGAFAIDFYKHRSSAPASGQAGDFGCDAGGLAPGASALCTGTVSYTSTGTYSMWAQVDTDRQVPESAEGNNIFGPQSLSVSSSVLKADLTVSALAGPATAAPSATIVMTDTTGNSGSLAAPATTTGYYLSSNSTWDTSDIRLTGRSVPALAPGATHAGTVSVTIPSSATGTMYVIARADSSNAVSEVYEWNNTRYKAYAFKPDLTVSALTGPTRVTPGATVTMTDTTSNSGPVASSANTTTRLYLSTNSTWDAADVALGQRIVGPLEPGAANSGSISVTIPASASGSIYIVAKADSDNIVDEGNERNNTRAKFYSLKPDLTVSALTVPASADSGSTITIKDTTRNGGTVGAPATITAYYLSTNTTWDESDQPLGSRPVAELAAGGTETASVSVTLPAVSGALYIIARADNAASVSEVSETNNGRYRAIAIAP